MIVLSPMARVLQNRLAPLDPSQSRWLWAPPSYSAEGGMGSGAKYHPLSYATQL